VRDGGFAVGCAGVVHDSEQRYTSVTRYGATLRWCLRESK